MTRPLQGKETKITVSLRIEPKKLKKIIKKYGSYSVWANKKLEEELKKG